MDTLKHLGAALLALAVPCQAAMAQEQVPVAPTSEPKISLQSDILAIVVRTDDQGRATIALTEPKEFTPGTKLSFGMKFANAGTEAATNVTGTSPINPAVRLAPDADPALIVSVDGGATFDTLDRQTVEVTPQGTRPATHADVTHVRWTIASIAPGESGRIAFPVIIR
ncbi:MAG: hypothetical protein HRT64_02440 [Erythrobacter sp.]|nr:hypothetical protein [Erythrobacter sp.]